MELVEVGDGDLEQVVVAAGDEGAFEHLGPGEDRRLEARGKGLRLLLQPHLDVGDESGADRLAVDERDDSADDSGRLERAHAPEARRGREADARRQLLVGDGGVLLQLAQDLAVDFIHAQSNATDGGNCNA